MKTKLYLLFFLCAPLFFIACVDQTETFDDQWRIANEEKFAAITADPTFTKLESLTGSGHIMYRVIQSGDESGRAPFFTDRVSVNYTGWFRNDWSREADYWPDDRGFTIINRIIFDTTYNRGNPIPRVLSISPIPGVTQGLIPGFTVALQHMVPGDVWQIWIPWELGYGPRGMGNIRGFTTLVFEIEMVRVI
jgi:peptidylprolyl isomerase/FKBP-type peptidyl-prolyl cis-trans isomerase FklB